MTIPDGAVVLLPLVHPAIRMDAFEWEEIGELMARHSIKLVVEATDVGLGVSLEEDTAPLRILASKLPLAVVYSLDWLLHDESVGCVHILSTQDSLCAAKGLLEELAVASGSQATYGAQLAHLLLQDIQLFESVKRGLDEVRVALAFRKQGLCQRLAELRCYPQSDELSWSSYGAQRGPWLFCPFAHEEIQALRFNGVKVFPTAFVACAAEALADFDTVGRVMAEAIGT